MVQSYELYEEANTVPSRSVEDDLIETVERMYHKRIAEMQREMHERMYEYAMGCARNANEWLKLNPNKGQYAKFCVDKYVHDQYQDELRRMEEDIAGEQIKLEFMKREVRQWCSFKELMERHPQYNA